MEARHSAVVFAGRDGGPANGARRGDTTPGQKCGACSESEARHNGQACQFRHRARLFTRQAGLCSWCGEALNPNLSGADIDHVIPVSRRGPWVEWNYQLLHTGCNGAKGALLSDRAYDLAAAHGFVIPDFIAVWEQPVRRLTFGRRTRQGHPRRWWPATGPVHLAHPGDEDKTLCGVQLRPGVAEGLRRCREAVECDV